MSAKILIVDDEANTLASLSRAFRLAGHEAVVCDNAARALELAQAQTFDLILSDVVMPKRDGLSLLEDLRNAGIGTPVVMMSGQAHIEMAVRATRLGAFAPTRPLRRGVARGPGRPHRRQRGDAGHRRPTEASKRLTRLRAGTKAHRGAFSAMT